MKALFSMLVVLVAVNLHSIVWEPGTLRLNEEDNFWRLISTSTYGYGWPGGEGSSTYTDYYYNLLHPAQYDSVMLNTSGQEQSYYRDVYTRNDYADYYEITCDKYFRWWENPWGLVNRELKRYNYQDQLLDYLLFNLENDELVVYQHYTYGYDAQGNRNVEKLYTPLGQLLFQTDSSYNPANKLILRNKFRWDGVASQLVQYFHEESFYSSHTSPDSISYWEAYGTFDNYTIYNSFNGNGNVCYSEKHRNDSIEKTYSDYVFAENRFFPLYNKTYKYINIQTEPAVSDSTITLYSYTNNYRSIAKNVFHNGSLIQEDSYVYNYDWYILESHSSYDYGDYGGNYSASYSWEFYSDVDDDVVIPSALYLSIYPNPVTGSATVKYKVSEAAKLKMSIYNLKGQMLYSANLGTKLEGDYSLPIPGSWANGVSLSSGIYFLRIEGGKQSQTTRFVLLR